MPSDTFLNLSKEKQKNILESAVLEFSENDFNDASINKIINRCGISRGSFYMYFKDKEDIYDYILNTYIQKFENLILKTLKKENGDFIKMCEIIYHEIIKFCSNDKNKKLLNNFFKEMSFSTEKKLFFAPSTQKFINDKITILNLINKEIYEFENEDVLLEAFMFSIFTTITAITHHFINIVDEKIESEIYLKRLHIIKYGICRKEVKK